MTETNKDARQHVAGALAAGVVRELDRPLRELRQNLALIIDDLDLHVTGSGGPVPLPYDQLETVRQQLADSYLACRTMSRLVSELSLAAGSQEAATEPIDVNAEVESALTLVRHRMSSGTELFVDLGTVPHVRAPAGAVTLAVAAQLMVAEESAGRAAHAAISVRTRRADGALVVTVADNGTGSASLAAFQVAESLGRDVAASLGGSFAAACEPGAGAAFEMRVPVRGG